MALALNTTTAVATETPQQAQSNCSAALLQGSWQLESALYLDANGKLLAEIKQQSTLSRKLIAGRHFSFITWQPDGKFEVAATGTFYTDSSGYHEQVDAASLPRLQGKSYHFQCRLTGDQWLHQGMEDGVLIKEVWQKLNDKAG
ncbi:hypothetical protein [Rheinheimera sp. 4Y26]|uniref:hypothetical protein n=1 Tax=Rheinheimera sp. 4Y26 TaxID=2977811 RepID=UPI0021B147F8|nr:hypothetical protein [Rheinheimera sp. 4Y26]MCT6698278.1 hypothetical protein [Rheinheimera sp. 4Y26]